MSLSNLDTFWSRRPPISHRETYRDTLTYAMAIAGGEAQFAARLKVPVPIVVDWLAGAETVPNDVFLLAVDIVLSATADEIRQSREILDRVKSSKH